MVRRIRPLGRRPNGVDPNQAITLRQVEGTEQSGVDEGEDRGRGPDSEGEDQADDRELAGTRAETREREPEVVEQHCRATYQCPCHTGLWSLTRGYCLFYSPRDSVGFERFRPIIEHPLPDAAFRQSAEQRDGNTQPRGASGTIGK